MQATEVTVVLYMHIKETVRSYLRGILPPLNEPSYERQEIREGWLKIVDADIQQVE